MSITEYLGSQVLMQAEFTRMQGASPHSSRREIKEASFPLMPEIKDTPESRAVIKKLGLEWVEPERSPASFEILENLLAEIKPK